MSAARGALAAVTAAVLTLSGSLAVAADVAQAAPVPANAAVAARALPDKPKPPCTPKKYPPKRCEPKVELSATQVAQGDPVTVDGSGFQPGELVTIALDGVVVGTVRADPNGQVHTTVTLPRNAKLGAHTITLTGQTSGSAGAAQVRVLPLKVKGEKKTRGSGLPFTGANVGPRVVAAVLMIVCGTALLRVRRRHGTA